ncbi:MAG: acyltransferase [Bacteroides sp.]|nr:acyltransferase [Bacteroides sp.]MCM1471419.1 acyltransferase [Bacteroides sp.]
MLALLIICCHYFPRYDIPLLSTWSWFGAPVVGCFFFLSGYGLSVSFATKGDGYIRGFISKRFARMLPAFVVMTALAWAVKTLALGFSPAELADDWIHGVPPLNTSWFVYALLLFYLIFYISAKLSHSPKTTGWILVGCTILYILVIRAAHYGGYWISSIAALPMGYFAALYHRRLQIFISTRRTLIIIAAIAIIWPAAILAEMRPQLLKPLVATAIPAAVYIAIVTYPRLRPVTILDRLGTVSYEIYLCQGFFCIFLDWLDVVLGALAMFAGTILLAFILHAAITRTSPLRVLKGC